MSGSASLKVCTLPVPVGISYFSNSLYIDLIYQSPKFPHFHIIYLYPKLMSNLYYFLNIKK